MNGYMDFATNPRAGNNQPGLGQGPVAFRQLIEIMFFVLDISGSMDCPDYPPTRLRAACEAALALLGVKLRDHPNDWVAIVAFSESAILVCPPVEVGSNFSILQRGLDGLVAKTSTDIAAGLEIVDKLVRGERVGTNRGWFMGLFLAENPAPPVQLPQGVVHRAVILSDGQNSCANVKTKSFADRLKQGGVTLDCIGIGGSPQEVDEDLLKYIASTGPDGRPRYRFISDKGGLLSKFEQLGGHLSPL